MPSNYPGALDDLTAGNAGLEHGDVTDALAAVQATLGVDPQGVAVSVVARLDTLVDGADGRTILSGSGAPASGSGLDPLDGISDPWRWSVWWGGWIGPAYNVSWSTGDEIPAYHVFDDTGGAGDSRRLDRVIVPSTPTITTSPDVDLVSQWQGGNEGVQTWTAPSDGAGVAYAVYTETGFTHSTVPDAAFDLAANLGDLVVGSEYVFADVQTGVDGDFYIDTTASALYGPKAGTWPTPVSLIGPAGADASSVILTSSPGNVQWRLVVDDAGALTTEAV